MKDYGGSGDMFDILSNHKFEYVMYRGGAGGEFLVYNICKYSKQYEPLSVRNFPNNRWHLEVPSIINAIALSRLRETPISKLAENIEQTLLGYGKTIEEAENELDNYLALHTKKHLFRTHISTNEYFHNKTFLLTLDSQDWFDYCNWLQFLKVTSETVKIIENSNNQLLARASELLKERIVDQILIAHVDLLNHPITLLNAGFNESNLEKFLNMSLLELSDRFNSFFFSKLAGSKYLKEQQELLPNMTPIYYSRLFKKGYLEDMFDIDSDEFHTELLKWHNANLILLDKMAFDVSKFKCII